MARVQDVEVTPFALYCPRRRWTTVEAEEVLRALERSGLSVAAFAAREGFDVQRLYSWRRRLRDNDDKAASPPFVEIKHGTVERVEIVLRSGRILRVAESVDADALRRIADALDEDPHC
jgi:transposase-like protein